MSKPHPKEPKHSKAAIKAHPAPRREEFDSGEDYAIACMNCHEARVEFDSSPELISSADQRLVLFAESYISNGGNGRKAAIAAGFSEKTADQQASRLLRNVKVSEIIARRQKELAKKYKIDTDMVIRSISQDLNFDPARLYNDDGSLKSITELDEDTRMSLNSVEFEQLGSPEAPVFVRKIKWAAKHQAREQAMKHLGMFERDNEQSRPVTKIVMVPPKRAKDGS